MATARWVLIWLFFGLLALPGLATPWTQKGQSWTHSNGMVITFQPEFTVKTEKNGTLNATANGGLLSLTFTPVTGKDEKDGKEQMKEAMQGLFQALQAYKVQMKDDSTTSSQNGIDVAYQDGETTLNRIPFLVRMGIYKKKNSYLLLQLLEPQQHVEKNSGLLKKVLGSIK